MKVAEDTFFGKQLTYKRSMLLVRNGVVFVETGTST